MSMTRFARLLVQEWRLFAANRSNLVLLTVLAALLGFSVAKGVARVTATQAAQQEAVEAATTRWADARSQFVEITEGRREKQQFYDATRADLVLMSHRNALVLKPTSLALLSVGPAREGHDIVAVGVQARGAAGASSRENPAIRLDGPLDAAFVITWLLPLMLIVLSYDVLSRDREQQVTHILASQGVGLGVIVLARLAVRFVAVFALTAGIVTVGVAVVMQGELSRAIADLALWLAALAVFIAFWLALGALVNAHSKNSAAAGLALMGFWVVIALLVPVVASQLLSGGSAAPQRLDSVLGRRALEAELTELAAEVTERYYAENPARRPRAPAINEYEKYFVESYYPRQVALDAQFEPLARLVAARKVEQAERLRTAALFSPSMAMKMLTDDVAGYAPERRHRFDTAAAEFQAKWRAFYDIKFASRTPLTLDDYDDAPRVAYRDEHPHARAVRNTLPAIGLLLAILLAALAAHTRLRRAGP